LTERSTPSGAGMNIWASAFAAAGLDSSNLDVKFCILYSSRGDLSDLDREAMAGCLGFRFPANTDGAICHMHAENEQPTNED